MLPYIKFLRVALPVATGACAIVATTLLVASFHDKDKLKKDEIDEVLKDLEKTPEEFRDEIIDQPDNKDQNQQDTDTKKDKGEGPSKDKKQVSEEEEAAARKKLGEKLLKKAEEIVIGDTTVTVGGEGKEVSPPTQGSSSVEEPPSSNQPAKEELNVDSSSSELGKDQLDLVPSQEELDPSGESRTEESEATGPKAKELQDDNLQDRLGEKDAQEESSLRDESEPRQTNDSDALHGEDPEVKEPPSGDASIEDTEDETGRYEDGKEQDAIEGGHDSESSDGTDGDSISSGGQEDSGSGSAQSPLTDEQLQTFLHFQEEAKKSIGSLGRLLFSR